MTARLLNRAIYCFTIALVLLSPAMAFAQDEAEKIVDARLEGYGSAVTLDVSTALTWILFIVLTVLCVAVLFKNPNRSHLD